MRPQHFALIAALTVFPFAGVVFAPAPLCAQANLSKAQIAEIAEKITVMIQTPAGSGSGVIIAREGDSYRVLTAWHVVESIKAGEEADITTPDGKTHRMDNRSIQRLPQVDMAVVSFRSGGNYTLAKVGNDLAVKRGMDVYVAGFPLPGRAINKAVLQFTDGTVTASSETLLTDGYALTYTNNTLPGMSGGAVLNGRGELVGIHGRAEGSYQSTGQENVALKSGFNLAIPIRTYTAWVNKAPLQTTTVATTAEQYLISGGQKLNQKNYQGAISDFNQAIKLDPNNSLAYVARGVVKDENLKDYSGAILDYNQAIKLDSNNALAYFSRGILKAEVLKDYSGAILDYNQAIKLKPNNALYHNNRGIVKADLKDYQGAISDYDKAIKIDPNLWGTYGNRADAKTNLKDYQGAINDYNQVIQINPNLAQAYNNRGILKLLLGNRSSGCPDLSQAMNLGYQRASQIYQKYCR